MSLMPSNGSPACHSLAVLSTAVILVTGLVLAGCSSGVTEEGFVKTEAALRQTAGALENGDLFAAERVFMQEADPFLHRLDPVLRRQNQPLARQLWKNMGRIELAFYDGDADPETLKATVEQSVPLLKEAARVLDLNPRWDTE